jgi:hypothetical protein
MPANADPQQFNAAVGVGSDTIQDISNAFAGFEFGANYTPVQSTAASKYRQIVSFNATPPAGVTDNCITPKLGAPSFTRPNGSSAGRRALSRAFDGSAGYGANDCGGVKDVSGLVDFARSSSSPASGDTGTDLTYIKFGRDGVSFAAFRASGGPAVTSLTRAQLTSLFTTGPQVIGGVRIVPCGIQTGSGTYEFWNKVTTATPAQENTATTECNAYGGTGRLQENDGQGLAAKGALAAAGDQVIVGFSAAAFIAKSNGVSAPAAPPAGVEIGAVSDNGSGVNLGSPVAGTAPNLAPNGGFYSDSIFGRNVYYVLPTSVIDSPFGNDDLKSLFKGSTSAICQQTTTIGKFGFLTLGASCGDSTLKGSFISGTV